MGVNLTPISVKRNLDPTASPSHAESIDRTIDDELYVIDPIPEDEDHQDGDTPP